MARARAHCAESFAGPGFGTRGRSLGRGRPLRRAVAAGLLAAVFALTGLGAEPPRAARADALAEIGARGMLRLGYREDAPPFSYLDDSNRPSGLAVELCEAAAPGVALEVHVEVAHRGPGGRLVAAHGLAEAPLGAVLGSVAAAMSAIGTALSQFAGIGPYAFLVSFVLVMIAQMGYAHMARTMPRKNG